MAYRAILRSEHSFFDRRNFQRYTVYMTEIDIHDFTLKNILIDWKFATLSLLLIGSRGEKSLRFDGMTRFELSRELPWGESVSVNGFKNCDNDSYEIEMQSGDTIRVNASSLTFD